MFIFKFNIAIKNILTKLWAYVSKCLIAFFDGIMKLRRFIFPIVAWIKRLFRPVLLSVFLIISNYFVNNLTYPIFDDIGLLMPFEFLTHAKQQIAFDEDSVLFVNIAYDKELTPVISSEVGDTIGNLDITDRGKLLQLLRIVKNSKYRYCFLDLRFSEPFVELVPTPNDSALFAELKTMKNCVISTHADIHVQPQIEHMAAYADLFTTATGCITRYNFLQSDDKSSVALKMYRDLNKGNISRCGLIYFSEGDLCYNSLFLPIPTSMLDKIKGNDEVRYPLLGSELLAYYSHEELETLINGKIVIVGDFEDDRHSTYVGDVPGALLSFLAYQELCQRHHIVSFSEVIVLFALYVLIFFLLFERRSLWSYIPYIKETKNRLFIFLLSLFSYGVVLQIINLLTYVLYDNVIVQPVALFTFSIISTIQKFKQEKLVTN